MLKVLVCISLYLLLFKSSLFFAILFGVVLIVLLVKLYMYSALLFWGLLLSPFIIGLLLAIFSKDKN